MTLRHAMAALAGAAIALVGAATHDAHASGGLTPAQRADLRSIAARTWTFYDVDVDPNTTCLATTFPTCGSAVRQLHLADRHRVYLWSIVAARDLHLIADMEARQRLDATLTAIEHLRKWNGFLLSWYDTTNGAVLTGPGGSDLGPDDSLDGQLISTVDNGWYASALVVVRQAFPQFRDRATSCSTRWTSGSSTTAATSRPTSPQGRCTAAGSSAAARPASTTGLLNTETRIAAYIGIGTHQMPGDVWWRTWRTLPASFDWQTQLPQGPTVTFTTRSRARRSTSSRATTPTAASTTSPAGAGASSKRSCRASSSRRRMGASELRRERPQLRAGLDCLRAERAPLPDLGTVPGEHARRHRRLRRIRRAPARLESRLLSVQRGRGDAACVVPRPHRHCRGGIREHRGAPQRLRRVRPARVLRLRRSDHAFRRASLPRARPVDDHGRARRGPGAGGLLRYYGADPVGQVARPYLAGETFSIGRG